MMDTHSLSDACDSGYFLVRENFLFYLRYRSRSIQQILQPTSAEALDDGLRIAQKRGDLNIRGRQGMFVEVRVPEQVSGGRSLRRVEPQE